MSSTRSTPCLTRHGPARWPLWPALALCLSLSPALADGLPTGSAAGSAPPADPLAAVRALIGDAACRSDADCQTIGVGLRACGGPTQYLAWSAYRSSGHALERVASRTRVRPQAEVDSGMMSTCQVLADPGARCALGAASDAKPQAKAPGRCELRARTAGSTTPPVR